MQGPAWDAFENYLLLSTSRSPLIIQIEIEIEIAIEIE
jgi:hypothetical protein